jgi:hypothetical protein
VGALDTYNAKTRRILTDGGPNHYWSDDDLNDYINEARIRVASDTKALRQLITGICLPAHQEAYNIVETVNTGCPANLGAYVIEIMSVTIIWGENTRVICQNRAFSEQNAKLRTWKNYYSRPGSLAMLGANVVYINPSPDHDYPSEWDVVIVPLPLETNSDIEVLPVVFQRCIPWYAAHLAKFQEQSISESSLFYQKYGQELQAAMYGFFSYRNRDFYRR